jgi:hypothetical protein
MVGKKSANTKEKKGGPEAGAGGQQPCRRAGYNQRLIRSLNLHQIVRAK